MSPGERCDAIMQLIDDELSAESYAAQDGDDARIDKVPVSGLAGRVAGSSD